MEKNNLDSYRSEINKEISEKVNDLDSNIFLVIAGSLGFFLTINEKFIGLKDASLKPMLCVSIVLLLCSLTLYLYNKHFMTNCEKEILDFIDDKMKPDNMDHDKILIKMWKRHDKGIEKRKKMIFGSLILGIITQIIFFMVNVMSSPIKKDESKQMVRIEIVNLDTLSKTHSVTIKTNH